MKRNFLLLSFIPLFLAGTAFIIADDVISRLGMDEKTTRYYIINNMAGNFSSGPVENYDGENEDNSFKIPYAKLLGNIMSGDKAGAARELCEYTKNYVSSEEFITDYNQRREDALPLQNRGTSISTLRKNSIVFDKNINNYKTDTKYVAEQQAKKEENQKQLDALLEQAKGDFQGRDVWEASFPADPAIIVRKRLEEYLKLVATVDFNAQLVDKNRKKIFANAAYEKKSAKWKACFRAGKEVNDVVTAFVKDWLKGEIIAKNKVKMPLEDKTVSASRSTKALTASSQTAPAATGSSTASAPAATSTEQPAAAPTKPVKEKKSLFNKLKEKTKEVTDVIKN